MSTDNIPGFTRLSAKTSIHFPPIVHKKFVSHTTTPSPALIVLCTWMGAAPKHIAKYTDGYRRLFPDTTILVCQTSLQSWFLGMDLAAGRGIVRNIASRRSPGRPIVLHAFSNGGSLTAIRLVAGLRQSGVPEIPLDGVILDCCPGTATVDTASRAVSFALPDRSFVRTLGYWFIRFTFGFYTLYHQIFRTEERIDRIRRRLADDLLFPRTTPRMYLYSKTDYVTKWEDIHRHAVEAKRAGYQIVQEVVFANASHCALLQADSVLYWAAVQAHIAGDDGYFKK